MLDSDQNGLSRNGDFSHFLQRPPLLLLPDYIAGDIMDSKRLRRIRDELDGLWQQSASIKPRDLVAIANRMELRESRQKGSHRLFVSAIFPAKRPISIPDHAKPPTLNRFTAEAILDQLEEHYQKLLDHTQDE